MSCASVQKWVIRVYIGCGSISEDMQCDNIAYNDVDQATVDLPRGRLTSLRM